MLKLSCEELANGAAQILVGDGAVANVGDELCLMTRYLGKGGPGEKAALIEALNDPKPLCARTLGVGVIEGKPNVSPIA